MSAPIDIEAIADHLASALRNYPCRCRPAGSWPAFQNTDKVFTCKRCEVLALHTAHLSIVQNPKNLSRHPPKDQT